MQWKVSCYRSNCYELYSEKQLRCLSVVLYVYSISVINLTLCFFLTMKAMALQTLPQNAVESWTNTLNLMDEIWFYAGDRSIDVSATEKSGGH